MTDVHRHNHEEGEWFENNRVRQASVECKAYCLALNLVLAWGDRVVAPLGLTSARWQILGAVVQADRPQPVAWLARDLGANRQNVQRIINDLEADGLISFEANPHHKRAQLVVLTAKGRQTYDAAIGLYNPLVDDLAAGLPDEDIAAAQRVLSTLRARLET